MISELNKAATVRHLRDLNNLYAAKLAAVEARLAAIEAERATLGAKVRELELRADAGGRAPRYRTGTATFPDGARVKLELTDTVAGG